MDIHQREVVVKGQSLSASVNVHSGPVARVSSDGGGKITITFVSSNERSTVQDDAKSFQAVMTSGPGTGGDTAKVRMVRSATISDDDHVGQVTVTPQSAAAGTARSL